MPWQNPAWYRFDKETINRRAPNASGVYCLKDSGGQCLYVGEAPHIASRLMGHLAGDDRCIAQGRAATFSFEPLGTNERIARRDSLALELQPLCNRGPG
jgi:excinuclease UvrABC nuclease subunit